jgi:hypothetical protein
MKSWESYPTFCYSAQGKNLIQTVPYLIFLCCNLSRIQFQQLRRSPKIITPKTSIVCGHENHRWKPGRVLFRLWYSTHGQILHKTVLVLFFLTAAPDQGETILVRPRDGPCSDLISFPTFMYSYISLKCFTLF